MKIQKYTCRVDKKLDNPEYTWEQLSSVKNFPCIRNITFLIIHIYNLFVINVMFLNKISIVSPVQQYICRVQKTVA